VEEPSVKLVNETFINRVSSNDPVMKKQAADAINDYTRIKMREDGFWRRILPPIQITPNELDRQVDTDKPVKVLDMEPESPAAVSVPFGALPNNRWIRGRRYRVMFDRILTPRFTKDVAELLTYDLDIRQILSDNSIKDLLAEEDGKIIGVINSNLGGIPDQIVAETNTIQWRTLDGGVTRDTMAEALSILPQTSRHLNCATVLINNITIWQIVKFTRDEIGGDVSQDLFLRGFTEREIMGVRWIVTIKFGLVPTNTIFMFAEPKFLGKFFVLDDVTMYVDRKAYLLEYFAYETIGSSIANVAGVARADFNAAVA